MAFMLENIFWASGFVLVCILIYRFGLPVLKRFDAENVARIARQEQEKADPSAHIRHALDSVGNRGASRRSAGP